MGLRAWAARAPVARYGNLYVLPDRVRRQDGHRREEHSLCRVSFDLLPGSALQARVSATRVVTGAVLGLGAGAIVGALARKKSGGETYLIIEGPGFGWTLEVPPDAKHQRAAREFVLRANRAARQAECAPVDEDAAVS